MRKIVYLLLLFMIPLMADGQRWKRERWAVYAGMGTNHFMGDLGGGAKDAAHFLGVRDMDWRYTRPTMQVGMRYRILEDLAIKPTISYAYIKGDDAESQNVGRQSRNLYFASNIWEFGAQFEYNFIKEKELGRYTFSSLRGATKISAFVILGGGGLYYNPKAEAVRGSGEWVALRPLHNEGQGSEPYEYTYKDIETGEDVTETVTPDKEYFKFAGYISLGLGAKYQIDRRWAVGLEITNRYTTTDYLDDAHDRYFYNPSNPFADRHLDVIKNEDGTYLEVTDQPAAVKYKSGKTMRGDPAYNDAYIFTVVTGYYKLKNTIKSMPKF